MVLAINNDSDLLAQRYIAEGVLPVASLIDASHIAIASVYELDMIVSLNFRHIVRARTIEMTAAINTLPGFPEVKIKTPM